MGGPTSSALCPAPVPLFLLQISAIESVIRCIFRFLFGGHTVVLRAYQSSEHRGLYGTRDQLLTKALSAGDYMGLGQPLSKPATYPLHCFSGSTQSLCPSETILASQFPGGCIPVIQDEIVPPAPNTANSPC